MKTNDLKTISESLIDTFNHAGRVSIDLFKKGLQIEIKKDKSPVSNGDLKVNEIISNKIKDLTPNIPIISEETVNLDVKNKNKIFWLIDPIDGTKEYIAGKDEYTLNASLVINTVPIVGLVGVPKKNRLFYTYNSGESFLIENGKITKPVGRLRFTQSFISSLGVGNVKSVGSETRFADSEFGEGILNVPMLHLNEFNFTGGVSG